MNIRPPFRPKPRPMSSITRINGMGRCRTSNAPVPISEIQGDDSVRLRIRLIVVRRPKLREVPTEVQFEVAPNTVTNITELGTASLRSGPRQGWEEHVVARLFCHLVVVGENPTDSGPESEQNRAR